MINVVKIPAMKNRLIETIKNTILDNKFDHFIFKLISESDQQQLKDIITEVMKTIPVPSPKVIFDLRIKGSAEKNIYALIKKHEALRFCSLGKRKIHNEETKLTKKFKICMKQPQI